MPQLAPYCLPCVLIEPISAFTSATKAACLTCVQKLSASVSCHWHPPSSGIGVPERAIRSSQVPHLRGRGWARHGGYLSFPGWVPCRRAGGPAWHRSCDSWSLESKPRPGTRTSLQATHDGRGGGRLGQRALARHGHLRAPPQHGRRAARVLQVPIHSWKAPRTCARWTAACNFKPRRQTEGAAHRRLGASARVSILSSQDVSLCRAVRSGPGRPGAPGGA